MRGRLRQAITAEVEERLKKLPRAILTRFNFFATADETIDYATDPTVYMPNEFTFFLDVENLGQLAREVLIDTLPMEASIWESRDSSIAELWIGGQDELLTKDERSLLKQATRDVWALPVRGKVFVIDSASLRSHARQLGTLDAIREAGGIVRPHVSPGCDYYVTDRKEAAEAALRDGAKRVVDTLTVTVMIGSRD